VQQQDPLIAYPFLGSLPVCPLNAAKERRAGTDVISLHTLLGSALEEGTQKKKRQKPLVSK
jgi:hypothetical protein